MYLQAVGAYVTVLLIVRGFFLTPASVDPFAKISGSRLFSSVTAQLDQRKRPLAKIASSLISYTMRCAGRSAVENKLVKWFKRNLCCTDRFTMIDRVLRRSHLG